MDGKMWKDGSGRETIVELLRGRVSREIYIEIDYVYGMEYLGTNLTLDQAEDMASEILRLVAEARAKV